MKKLIYIIVMALCLSACCFMEEIKRQESAVEKEYLYLRDGQSTSSVCINRFEYDGHKYILFYAGEAKNGFVHDPDCPCREQYAPKGENKQETSDYPDWW